MRAVPSAAIESSSANGLGRPMRWGLLVALWCIPPILATATFVLNFQGETPPVSWTRFLRDQLTLWLPWVLLTPVVTALGRRHPFEPGWRLRHLGIHFLASVLIGALFFGYVLAREVLAGLDLSLVSTSMLVSSALPVTLLHAAVYWILLLVSRTVAYHQRNREREASLTRARLQALKAQVHPHFLFNTLHAISALMEDDVEAARGMVVKLSELLRESLAEPDGHEVRLGDELALTKLYLEIERQRFGERLNVTYEVDEEADDLLVPHLVLQPLVENAIHHGVARDSKAGRLTIGGRRDNGVLELTITDDGPGVDELSIREGIGLGGTRTRLRELYGDAAKLSIGRAGSRGCRVAIELPARSEIDDGADSHTRR